MRNVTLTTSAIALAVLSLGMADRPSGDGDVRFIGHDQVQTAFEKGMPLIEVGDYKIHASRREGPGMAEIHTRDTDIAYVLRGSATLVTGGTAVDARPTGPEELRGSAIRGGETRRLAPGDVVVIPNGTPHWFKDVEAPFLYYVVKVRQAPRQMALETAR
jgi:mannose-6-phosphate isomerase-like protein (cupin superfamily)